MRVTLEDTWTGEYLSKFPEPRVSVPKDNGNCTMRTGVSNRDFVCTTSPAIHLSTPRAAEMHIGFDANVDLFSIEH